jgi:signal transduction histidine kinase
VNNSLKYYKQLSLLALMIFLLLVSLQIVWVVNAVKFQEREIIHELKEVVADVAMEINGINHNAFHGKLEELPHIPMETMTKKVTAFLVSKDIVEETYFAIFQDTIGGIFRTNQKAFKEQLLQSDVRACISCIMTFSTIAEKDSEDFDPEKLSEDSIQILSTFQYYSPVKGLKKDTGKTLWLSLYQPNTLSKAIKSLLYLFAGNVLLLLSLIALFYHLLKSLSKHKQITKIKDDFFNNVTHEFKTPLSSIHLASRVLRENNDPVKRKSYHDLIEKESKSLEYQIDKLLELSLIDSNELSLEKDPINLCTLIQEIPAKLKPLLEHKSGKLHIDCRLDKQQIVGDHYHLLNSFCNLVENSLKYSPKGVNIWIEAILNRGSITVSIKDNGPGIPEEHRTKIFSRFYRGQKNDKYKGTGFGIGLSYVKSIIEGHNGDISMNTQYEEGTEFIIRLPNLANEVRP